jgi:hypothetical protein
MTDDRPRSSYESNNVSYSKGAARRDMRTTIGQELRARFGVPEDLPHEILTLLTKMGHTSGAGP